MKPFNPAHLSQLQPFLRGLNKKPSKAFSQNFLIDNNIINKIIATADVQSNDVIFEIGPGAGALTCGLLQTGATVIAVENDPVLARALQALEYERLFVFKDDILSFPLEEILNKHLANDQKAKVVANLPYHITGPIFGRLLPLNHLFSSLTLMLQKELGDRITASPNTKAYGAFSLFNQIYSIPKAAFTVSPHCFYPKPKVDSQVLHIVLKEVAQTTQQEGFIAFIKAAFQQRRKLLSNNLADYFDLSTLQKLLEALQLTPNARAEQLELHHFTSLYQHLPKTPS